MSDLVSRLLMPMPRHMFFKQADELCREAAAEITRLQKELETAREALEPFVQYAPEQCFVGSGRFTTIQTIEAGGGWFGAEDFRRARKVYLSLKDKEVAG